MKHNNLIKHARLLGLLLITLYQGEVAANESEPVECQLAPTVALDDGLATIQFNTACAAKREVMINYKGIKLTRWLDDSGKLDVMMPLFAKENQITIHTAEQDPVQVDIPFTDIDNYTQIALVWQKDVDLDLHVLEPRARVDESGHISSRTPQRGVGTLRLADQGHNENSKIEYYHAQNTAFATSGVIGLKIEYVSRGETPQLPYCGDGPFSEVKARLYLYSDQRFSRRSLRLPSKACGLPVPMDAQRQETGIDVMIHPTRQ